jgi:predicted nucleic acid-binding protein
LRYLLDTTVLIDYLRGKRAVERVRALYETGDVPCTTAINVEEVVRGLRPKEAAAAHDLVAGLEILPITLREGWRAGSWRREYARRGVTLWQADCLIAAAAVESGATLATGNPKDFPMSGLTVAVWPVGQ